MIEQGLCQFLLILSIDSDFRKVIYGILAEKTPVITIQSKKELKEEMLLVKDSIEFEDISKNPEENQDDEAAEDGEGEEEE